MADERPEEHAVPEGEAGEAEQSETAQATEAEQDSPSGEQGEAGESAEDATDLEAELEAAKDVALRAQADAMNVQRRAEQEIEKARKFTASPDFNPDAVKRKSAAAAAICGWVVKTCA